MLLADAGVGLLRFKTVMRITVSKYLMLALTLALTLALSTPVLPAQKRRGAQINDKKLIGYVGGVDVGASGCDFQFAGESRSSMRYIFFEDISDGVPYMNIDGRNVRLKLVGSTEPYRGAERKGERFVRRYTSGDIRVRMDIVVTKVCDPYDESCEFNWHKAVITVTRGNRTQTVEAVGGCGS